MNNLLPNDMRKITILIVDDMSFNVSFVQQTLINLGHVGKIFSANNVAVAITKINEIYQAGEAVDFIISDLNLGDKSGIDFVKKIRANDRLAKIPFILFTTENNPAKILEAVIAGADDYFLKPIEEDTVLAKMCIAWNKHKN